MVVGGIISSISLLIMAFAKSLGVFSSAFFFLSLSNNMIMAPYSALIPDVVSEEQVPANSVIGNTVNESNIIVPLTLFLCACLSLFFVHSVACRLVGWVLFPRLVFCVVVW